MELHGIVNEAIEFYRHIQSNHPHVNSMIFGEIMYTAANVAAQLIEDRNVDLKKVKYAAGLGWLYGLITEKLVESGQLVEKYGISSHPLVRAALGPNLWSNLFSAFFFINNSLGEKNNYSLKELWKHYKNTINKGLDYITEGFYENKLKLKEHWSNFKESYLNHIPGREYLKSVAGIMIAWNAFQWWNLYSQPVETRTTNTLLFSFIYTTVLSLWALQAERREMQETLNERTKNPFRPFNSSLY